MKTVLCQLLDWRTNEYKFKATSGGFEEYREALDHSFEIYAFGRSDEGKSVCLVLTGFTPHFYIRVSSSWGNAKIKSLLGHIYSNINETISKNADYTLEYDSYEVVKLQDIYDGFKNGKLNKFVKISFKNMLLYKKYAKYFMNELITIPKICDSKKFKLYEATLEPLLKCIHVMDVNTCGWVTVDGKLTPKAHKKSKCTIEIEVPYDSVRKVDRVDITKLILLSYDIECTSVDGSFPQAKREHDRIIQIGNTFAYYNESESFRKVIFTLKECGEVDGVEVRWFSTERAMLVAWAKFIGESDSDLMQGHNNTNFDDAYIYGRSIVLKCSDFIEKSLGKLIHKQSDFREENRSSSGMGVNLMKYYDMNGIILFDMFRYAKKSFTLSGYSLNDVVSNFIRESVSKLDYNEDAGVIFMHTKSTKGLSIGSFIILTYDNGISKTFHKNKYQVLYITDKEIFVRINESSHEENYNDFIELTDYINSKVGMIYWSESKDDVTPAQISEFQKEGPYKRAIIAKYCIKDCELVNKLNVKLGIIASNLSLANIALVPLNYIFNRGQGIKSFSLLTKYCSTRGAIILTRDKSDVFEGKFKGAYVLDPKPAVYMIPIFILDFSSLYPSSIIEGNCSHETLVLNMKYMNVVGYTYREVKIEDKGAIRTHIFAQKIGDDGKPINDGILPQLLLMLLTNRKAINTRKAAALEEGNFALANILDGDQIACKLTGNSTYGQLGNKKGDIYNNPVAESTTALGREKLELGQKLVKSKGFLKYLEANLESSIESKLKTITKDAVEDEQSAYNILSKANPSLMTTIVKRIRHMTIEIIYGDTDSLFCNAMLTYENNEFIKGDEGLAVRMLIGILAGDYINTHLTFPQKIVYEKTFYPFIIPCKKKYAGVYYTTTLKGSFIKYMGIALKKRDIAPVTKEVIGGILDCILNKRSLSMAIAYVRKVVADILDGKYPLYKFIITKSLKSSYAIPKRIAHKVLADRVAERDPGNAFHPGDRIPYVYIVIKNPTGKKMLQGNKIETPQFIEENHLEIDYVHYVTNQIINPTIQFLGIMMYDPISIFEELLNAHEQKKMGIINLNTLFNIKPKSTASDLEEKDMYIQEWEPDTKIRKKKISVAVKIGGKYTSNANFIKIVPKPKKIRKEISDYGSSDSEDEDDDFMNGHNNLSDEEETLVKDKYIIQNTNTNGPVKSYGNKK